MKMHLVAGGAVCAALAIPAVASAHNVAVTCDPVTHAVTAQGSSFPATPLVTQARLTIDGVPQAPVAITPGLPGPNPRFVFPSPLFGAHTLVATFVNGGPWTSPATQVNCGTVPPVVPPVGPPSPGPVPPPAASPPPPPAIVPPVVVKPKPKVTKKPKPRPKITCAYFKRTHPTLGPKAYAKLGLRYYVCHVPKGKRTMPPVTG